jgi:hypothetical protein
MEDYQQHPIQNYGMSLLEKMGFSEERGIGRRKENQLSDIFVIKPNPKGRGLGAHLEEPPPSFEVGDSVLIAIGPHEGLTGCVAELGQDTHALTIELHLSHSRVRVNAKGLKKISKAEVLKIYEQWQREQPNPPRKKKRLKWVVPHIRVKVINSTSPHYLKKFTVTDLIDDRDF